ncbi:hypothetical protein Tco_1238337 [Tanacetum coccineum]
MTHSSTESKTSLAIAVNLSELELKMILIEKIESNKSINRSNEQKNLYMALVEAYESDKLILDTYGDIVSFKRRRDDEDKDEEPSAGSNRGFKRRRVRNRNQIQTSAPNGKRHRNNWQVKLMGQIQNKAPDGFQKPVKIPSPDRDWNKTLPTTHGPVQPWLSTLAQMEDLRKSINVLMDTPLDFSAFVIDVIWLKFDNLNSRNYLAGLTFKLMKGSCKSLVELEYLFEEVYKATTDQLDWK